jgi:para-nitrobenzyl esterase
MTQEQYEAAVRAQLGTTLGDAALAEYEGITPPRAAYVRLTSDARFICPTREIARGATAGQTEPVRRYFFRYAPGPYGAPHGIELVYLFGNFDAVVVNGEPYQPTATDLALSQEMQARWTAFASGGLDGWPAWDDSDPALVLDADVSVEQGAGADHCDFWRPYYEAL